MAQRILRQRMETYLIERTKQCQMKGNISNTQLSRLRIIARRALDFDYAKSKKSLADLLDTLPSNARNQFETAKIEGESLMNWLKQRINDSGSDWQKVDTVDLGGTSYPVDDQLKWEYTLRLIIAVARQAIKEAK